MSVYALYAGLRRPHGVVQRLQYAAALLQALFLLFPGMSGTEAELLGITCFTTTITVGMQHRRTGVHLAAAAALVPPLLSTL